MLAPPQAHGPAGRILKVRNGVDEAGTSLCQLLSQAVDLHPLVIAGDCQDLRALGGKQRQRLGVGGGFDHNGVAGAHIVLRDERDGLL